MEAFLKEASRPSYVWWSAGSTSLDGKIVKAFTGTTSSQMGTVGLFVHNVLGQAYYASDRQSDIYLSEQVVAALKTKYGTAHTSDYDTCRQILYLVLYQRRVYHQIEYALAHGKAEQGLLNQYRLTIELLQSFV